MKGRAPHPRDTRWWVGAGGFAGTVTLFGSVRFRKWSKWYSITRGRRRVLGAPRWGWGQHPNALIAAIKRVLD